MQGQEPERSEITEIFRELFSANVEHIDYQSHPSADVLRSYLNGTLENGWNDPQVQLSAVREQREIEAWHRNDVTAHVITCRECQHSIEVLRSELETRPNLMAQIERVFARLREQFVSLPKPALAVIGVQTIIIAALGLVMISDSFTASSTATINGLSSNQQTSSLPEPSAPIGGSPSASDLLQEIQNQVGDDRIKVAEEIKERSENDSTLWGAIPQMMQDAETEKERELLSEGFNNGLASVIDDLKDTIAQIEQFQDPSSEILEFPDPNLINELQSSLASLSRSVRKFNLSANLDILLCTPTIATLSLLALDPILKEYDGTLVYDPASQNRFEVQLPPLYTDSALPLLREAGLTCSHIQ